MKSLNNETRKIMNQHLKGLKLANKVIGHARASTGNKRIVRRVLRCWARHWEVAGSIDLARQMRKDARKLF